MAFYAARHPERRFILVFSPKCGTRTCKRWFLDTISADGLGTGDDARIDSALDEHLVAVEDIGDPRYADHHVAMVVRDPHRRLVSAYVDLFLGRPHEWGFTDLDGHVRIELATFRQVVESVRELHQRGTPLQHHLEPQVARIVDLSRVDRFLLVEHLDRDLAALARAVGHTAHRPTRLGRTDYAEPAVDLVADRRPAWFRTFGTPTPASFYDRDLHDVITDIYRPDVELHRSLAGAEPLEPAW